MAGSARSLGLAGAMSLVIAAAGCSAVETTQVKGYMFSQSALDQIPVGSSQEQVLVVLGTPSTTATVNGEVFYYISATEKRAMRFMKPSVTDQKVVAVYFDKNRKVERLANYGIQDGVAFDFISRKTPTPGVEKTLVSQLLGLVSF